MTATFNYTKQQIIYSVLRDLNVISLKQTPTSEMYDYVSDKLNLMIKKWEAISGINLWKRRQATLFPAYGTASYSLGTAGDHCTASYVNTDLASDAASGASTLTVTSITGISSGDYIGIELDGGTRQWTTVNGAPSGTTITLTDVLTGAASTDNIVITYTTKINRPLGILRATTKSLLTGSETQMGTYGYDGYFDLPIKTSAGRPNNYYYDRLISGSNPYTGTMYLYPVTNNVNEVINFTYQDPLSDALLATDYLDFPAEWLSPIISNLSCIIARHFGKYQELQVLLPVAEAEFLLLKSFDGDDEPIQFSF